MNSYQCHYYTCKAKGKVKGLFDVYSKLLAVIAKDLLMFPNFLQFTTTSTT